MRCNLFDCKTFFIMLLIALTNQSLATDPSEENDNKSKILGSRINKNPNQSISPVIVFTREDLINSGHNNLQDFVRTLTVSSANNADDYNNSYANGTSTLNLRGIGGNSTLVLVNGRRVASYGQGQNITQSFVDLNSISFTAINRIEILAEGASAIYGADAVAGVVNIILRKDYQGAEYTLGYQTDTDGDTPQTSFNAIIGAGNDRTSFTTTFNYLKRKALFYRDRDFSADANQSANGGVDQRSAFGYPGSAFSNSGDFVAAPGCRADLVRSQFGGTVCSLNYNEFITFYPETERFGTSMTMNHEISDNVNLYIDTSLQRNRSVNIAAPAPFIGPYGPLGNSTFDALSGNHTAVVITFGGLGLYIPADQPFNPFGEEVGLLHRPIDFGPRTGEIHSNSYRFVTGVEGLVGDTSWDYDVNIGYTRNDILIENRNSINAIALQALVLGVQDPAGSGDTLYYNPFGANDQRVIDYARLTNEKRNTSWEKTATANFSGSLMEMPAGDLAMAVGIEYRESSLSQEADPLRNSGSLLGTSGESSNTFGERNQYSIYAELAIPLLENLDIQLAGRFENYSDFGTTTTPKIGARWQVNDNLVLRGSWGESFRAPSLQELYMGSVSSFQSSLIDPITFPICDPNINPTISCPDLISPPIVNVLETGNPFVNEEQSTSWNLGLNWQINSLNLSFDYFNYDIKDIIQKISPQFTLYLNNPNLVIRVDGPLSAVDFINNGPVNASKLKISGWDLALNYSVEIADGILSLNNNTTYYDTFDYFSLISLPSTSDISLLNFAQSFDEIFLNPPIDGTGNTTLGNLSEFTNNLSAHYIIGNHEFYSSIHYRNGLDIPSQSISNNSKSETPSITTLDLNYSYKLTDDSTLQFGCINCTDKNPAFNPDPNNSAGYFQSLDDPRGAVVYARLTQSF